MPLASHPYVSTVTDSTDTSLVRPVDWNSDHVVDGFLLAINRATLTSTSTLTLMQQTQLLLTDNISGVDHVISGVPRQPRINQMVPSGYDLDVIAQLALPGSQRMSVLGTGQIVMSDDFKTRQRIVLAG
jgi:hypothetical protein